MSFAVGKENVYSLKGSVNWFESRIKDWIIWLPTTKGFFSPDNISNRNVTFSTFYPGDDYVDWIGMSTYHNTNFAGDVTSYDYNAELYGVDAYYGRGLYDNDPLVIIAPIVEFAVAHDKPVMVSECGFSYRGEASDADQTAFAADQLNKFYSYVNMIYPQVKAVFITLGSGK